MLPYTKKMIARWGGQRKFIEGEALYDSGTVFNIEYEHPQCTGEIARGERSIRTRFRLCEDGTIEPLCPCYESTQRGLVCVHVVALALALLERSTDPDRARKALEEERKARRMQRVDESKYIQRVTHDAIAALPAAVRIELGPGWESMVADGAVPLLLQIDTRHKRWPIDAVPRGRLLQLSKEDEAVLFVLEDVAEGPPPAEMEMTLPDFINILNLLKGSRIYAAGRAQDLDVNPDRRSSSLRVTLDHDTGELLLTVASDLPLGQGGPNPLYIVANRSGWVYCQGSFWPLNEVLPPPLLHLYKDPVAIARSAVPHFVLRELPMLDRFMTVESEISADLFEFEPASPGFTLRVKGSPASLAAELYARYGDRRVIAGREDSSFEYALPDPDDLLLYYVRNPEQEETGLQYLAEIGFRGRDGGHLASIVGLREVLNFMGRDLPELHRRGWEVELEGAISQHMEEATFAVPVVRVREGEGGWFEVNYDFEDSAGGSLSQSDVYRALQKGESYIQKNGRITLLDSQAIGEMTDVFRDCSESGGAVQGSFRVSSVYSPYIKSSLDALDGVDVEAPRNWLVDAERKRSKTVSAPVQIPDHLERILRPYQKKGVEWMRSLEELAFGGVLADEMGLGKTLQTLVWISAKRLLPESEELPALVVCPTSLVENWAEEAQKFVPGLRVLILTGAGREKRRERIGDADLCISSYAIMRRDIDFYEQQRFSIVVLDEAQHIKNHSTQNAQAAKRIRADNRMVLTGTPIENGVSDIWSIMDFLMPGYLGAHRKFRENYERPIMAMGREGERAQRKLQRKLQPFILRRTKRVVASELPDKIEKVAYCKLTPDQQRVYNELAKSSRRHLDAMVRRDGFNRSRMEVLKVLLRLRQTCCHLDLLGNEALRSEDPSGKTDMFFELLDEALDGGHRVLVFSQFVSMLSILRAELESRGLQYCYLDGSTKNRMEVVHRFNSDSSIPIFLISLKAGGVGLNLTGADMVMHFDPWWNPAVEAQATDRAHRIGQKRTVYSIKLIAKGTVEEKVLAMQERKRKLIEATISAGGNILSKLSWDEVRALLDD